MTRLVTRCRRLAEEREFRLALLVALPLVWLALAWRDVGPLVLAVPAIAVATVALRAIARRRGDDEFVL